MTKRRLTLFAVLIIIGVGGSLLFLDNLLSFLAKIRSSTQEQVFDLKEFNLIEKIEPRSEEISTPPLQKIEPEVPGSFLTRSGIIQWTNIQRKQYALPPLRENPKLNASAQEKMEDMFEEQYFAHTSPGGLEVKDLAKKFRYEFLAIGENLALGNFQNDQGIVQAWMESPGHRENILSEKYQEIGVAVGRGIFKGQSLWLAVQHFGLPLSACLEPQKELLTKIEEKKAQIEEILTTLTALKKEIEVKKPRPGPIYGQKVEEYNILVGQYNNLVEEVKDLINQYNSQVQIFNECAN